MRIDEIAVPRTLNLLPVGPSEASNDPDVLWVIDNTHVTVPTSSVKPLGKQKVGIVIAGHFQAHDVPVYSVDGELYIKDFSSDNGTIVRERLTKPN